MGPKDSFNGALTWLLHFGDKEPLAAYIKKNGIQKGVEADALSQLLMDARFQLGATTTPEDDLMLEACKHEWRIRETLRQLGQRLNEKDFPKRFIEVRLRQARPELKRAALQKEVARHIQQFKRWRRDDQSHDAWRKRMLKGEVGSE
jgi:hypothetical protein